MHDILAYLLIIASLLPLDQCTRKEVQCVRIANVLLANEISDIWLWPARLPPMAVCKTVRTALKDVILKDSKNYEEVQEKVKGWNDAESTKEAKKAAGVML